MSSTSELLPEPLTPVTTVTTPSGKATSRSLRLCCRAPRTTSAGRRRPAGRRLVGTGIAALPLRYWPVSDFLLALTFAGRPGRGDLAAAVARAGAEVDEVVGRLDDLAVVLDQDQRVAQVAEVPQGRQQPGVVARVQADRRLVEHVEHARQAAADLAGQADPLALAAGERRRAAGQRQVVEPDVDQELQPVADLADQVAGDVLLVAAQLQRP